MNKALKISLITIISILMVFSLLSMGLYYYLPAVERNETFALSTDTNGNPYIDVEYWSNKENNGVELLDIRLHGYATAEDFEKDEPVTYYKGIQFVGDKHGSIVFDFDTVWSISNPFGVIFSSSNYKTAAYKSNVKAYYYDSQNNINFKSFNELTDEYRFKVSVESGENTGLYFLKLLGQKVDSSDTFLWHTDYYCTNFDLMYLSNKILETARANSEGNDYTGTLSIDVGTMFDYMKYSEHASEQKWASTINKETGKVETFLQEFALVNFTVHSDGAKFASDSMFGIIADSSDFEYVNPDIKNTYLLGKQVVELTEKNFTIAETKLDFTNRTKTFLDNNNLNISILIDLDSLNMQDIEYNGFSETVKTYSKRITSITLKQTVNGTTIYSEVEL